MAQVNIPSFSSVISPISLRSLSSARYGKLPRTAEDKFPSYYSDLITEYSFRWLQVGARLEGFTSPDRQDGYGHLSQRYAEASWRWGTARLGNCYGIYGRGIILRGFELPGFIYESQVYRQQQQVIRDFDGYKLSLTPGPLAITILDGTPVDPLRPPEDETRRFGKVAGAQASVTLPGGANLGAAYLEHRTTFTAPLATRFLGWSADELLTTVGLANVAADFYGEYATIQGTGSFGKIDATTPHGFYLSGNLTWKSFGASLEYKNYRQFDFGINDPPPAVRENTEYLLNRATHVLHHNTAEKGYQLEVYYSPSLSARFIGHYSLARYEDATGFPFLFQERYFGVEWSPAPWVARLFIDTGQDDETSEIERFTAGLAADYQLSSGPTLGADWQWQRIRRASLPFFDYTFRNSYLAIRLQDWHKLSLAIRCERSEDPDYATAGNYFASTTVGWQPIPAIDLLLFAGKRRGGTACDHGYCIEVLDFEGAELRLEMRW